MKTIRFICVCMAAVMLFCVSVLAVAFTPSAERKPTPEIVDYQMKDAEPHIPHGTELIITPLAHLYDDTIELHEDIERSLEEAKHDLENLLWHDMVHDFHEHWDRVTGGAPIENAVVSDIFDVRLLCELGNEGKKANSDTTVRSFGSNAGITFVSTSYGYSFASDDVDGADLNPDVRDALSVVDYDLNGEEITFSVKIQGLSADDTFLVITRCSEADEWDDTEFTMSEDGVLTITEKTMSAFAIVRDAGKDPSVDPDDPDSPQTGVPAYLTPAVIGAVVFAGLAAVCVKKIVRREEA